MPFYEGVGLKAPRPVRVLLVKSDNLHHFWVVGKIISEEKGYKTENYVMGAYGEAALSKWLLSRLGARHLCNSLQRMIDGDGGVDIIIYGHTIQVKTSKYNNRVPRLTQDKKSLPIKADIFVFVKPETSINNSDFASLSLKGFCFKSGLENFGILTPNKFNSGFDLVIEDDYLLPMEQLVSYLYGKKT